MITDEHAKLISDAVSKLEKSKSKIHKLKINADDKFDLLYDIGFAISTLRTVREKN